MEYRDLSEEAADRESRAIGIRGYAMEALGTQRTRGRGIPRPSQPQTSTVTLEVGAELLDAVEGNGGRIETLQGIFERGMQQLVAESITTNARLAEMVEVLRTFCESQSRVGNGNTLDDASGDFGSDEDSVLGSLTIPEGH